MNIGIIQTTTGGWLRTFAVSVSGQWEKRVLPQFKRHIPFGVSVFETIYEFIYVMIDTIYMVYVRAFKLVRAYVESEDETYINWRSVRILSAVATVMVPVWFVLLLFA